MFCQSALKLLLLFILMIQCMAKSCFEETLFSTKTPYKLVQNDDLEVKLPDESCKAIHINMVHRHGHRYPSEKDMKDMKELEKILNQLKENPTDVQINLPWKCPFKFEQDKILTTSGEKELFSLGKRIQSRFPDIFSNNYTPFTFKFQSTCKLRCTHSALSLASGLFHGVESVDDEKNYKQIALDTIPCDHDHVLRFFDHCDKYLKIDNDPSCKTEINKFMEGSQVKAVLDKVKQKLGDINLPLKSKHIKSLFLLCAYEIAMFDGNKTTGMCSLLDDDDIKVLEYTHDQKNYYLRSTAHKINYESSCPLLADIVNTMKASIYNTSITSYGVFRSAHAETLVPLYALLGLFTNSEPLNAENFDKMKSRIFRGACLAPFSGNIYFVLFDCNGKHKIQLHANERLVRMPCCADEIDCDFDAFLKYYGGTAENCQLKEMCRHENDEL